jgi:hypothetical protein
VIRHAKEAKMKIRKCLSSNQRKRTLHRNKVRLANRRHTQFSVDQYSNEESSVNAHNELGSS